MGMARVAAALKPFGMSAFLQLIAILRYTSGCVYCRLLVFIVAVHFPNFNQAGNLFNNSVFCMYNGAYPLCVCRGLPCTVYLAHVGGMYTRQVLYYIFVSTILVVSASLIVYF